MSSNRPGSAPGSPAAVFYAVQRSALPGDRGAAVLFDPGHRRASKPWAVVLAGASHRRLESALAARAFVGG